MRKDSSTCIGLTLGSGPLDADERYTISCNHPTPAYHHIPEEQMSHGNQQNRDIITKSGVYILLTRQSCTEPSPG
jgi:hypothetical protein